MQFEINWSIKLQWSNIIYNTFETLTNHLKLYMKVRMQIKKINKKNISFPQTILTNHL